MELAGDYDEGRFFARWKADLIIDYEAAPTYHRKRIAIQLPGSKIAKHHHTPVQKQDDAFFDETAEGYTAAKVCRVFLWSVRAHADGKHMIYKQDQQLQALRIETQDAQEQVRTAQATVLARDVTMKQMISKQDQQLQASQNETRDAKEQVRAAQAAVLARDVTIKQLNREHATTSHSLKREQVRHLETTAAKDDEIAALRLRCEQLEHAANKMQARSNEVAEGSEMETDGASYQAGQLAASQSRIEELDQRNRDLEAQLARMAGEKAAAVAAKDKQITKHRSKIAKLEDELKQCDEQIDEANREIECLMEDQTPAYTTPQSLQWATPSSLQALTPVTPSISGMDLQGPLTSTSGPVMPAPQALKSLPTPDSEDPFAAIESRPSKSQAEKLAGQSKKAMKQPQRPSRPSHSSTTPSSSRTSIGTGKTPQGGLSKTNLAAIASAVESLKTENSNSPVKISPVNPSGSKDGPELLTPEEVKRLQEEERLRAKRRQSADRQYVHAKQLWDSGDYKGIKDAFMQGKPICDGEQKSILYFSCHYSDPENMVMAQIGNLATLTTSANPFLRYNEARIGKENKKDKVSDREDPFGFALQCLFTQIPEIQLRAASALYYDQRLEHETWTAFKQRFENVRGQAKEGSEMTRFKNQWSRAILKLKQLPEFFRACEYWAAGQPSRGKWCWPPTFVDPTVARKTLLDPDADQRFAQEEKACADLGVDLLVKTNFNKDDDDDLSAALLQSM